MQKVEMKTTEQKKKGKWKRNLMSILVRKGSQNIIVVMFCPWWQTRQLRYFRSSIVLDLTMNESQFESEVCSLIA
jgi:hypothetical protein